MVNDFDDWDLEDDNPMKNSNSGDRFAKASALVDDVDQEQTYGIRVQVNKKS